MTRKDYQLIAETIARTTFGLGPSDQALRERVANEFALALSTNPRFDPDRFIAAATGRELERRLSKPPALAAVKEG